MGVDYDPVGGVGIEVTDEIVKALVENKAFTQDEWDEDPCGCMEDLGIPFNTAGSAYSGDEWHYLLVDGKTLMEVNQNVPDFIANLKEKGVTITEEDIDVISDLHIW